MNKNNYVQSKSHIISLRLKLFVGLLTLLSASVYLFLQCILLIVTANFLFTAAGGDLGDIICFGGPCREYIAPASWFWSLIGFFILFLVVLEIFLIKKTYNFFKKVFVGIQKSPQKRHESSINLISYTLSTLAMLVLALVYLSLFAGIQSQINSIWMWPAIVALSIIFAALGILVVTKTRVMITKIFEK